MCSEQGLPPGNASLRTGGQARSHAARLLALLFAINLLNYIDRYVLAGVLPLLELEFSGITKERLGWLAPAFLLAYMVTSPAFGLLGDRVRRMLLVGLGVQLWSLATAASGLTRTFWQLAVCRVFVGVGEASYGTAAPALISDLYERERRGRAMAFFYVAIPVGSALGYLLGGLIGARWGWRSAFWIVGTPGIVIGMAAYFLRDPVRGGSEGLDDAALDRFLSRRPKWRDYRDLLRVPSYVLNTLGMTAYTYAIGGISFWMPTFLHQERGLPLDQANFYFGLVTVATGITGTLAGGLIADRLGRRWRGAYFLLCGCGMLLAFPFFYHAIVATAPGHYWAAIVGAELLLFLNTGPSNTILVNVTLPSIRTSAVALNIFVIHALGDVLSPVVMGRIADRSDMATAFLSTSAMVVLGGLIWLAGTPFLARDTDRVVAQMRSG